MKACTPYIQPATEALPRPRTWNLTERWIESGTGWNIVGSSHVYRPLVGGDFVGTR